MNIAVITGASSGMGRDLLFALEKEFKFDEIWAIARREERLAELQDKVTTKIRPIPLDLTDEASYDKYKSMLEAEKPNVTLLLNCSGFGQFGHIENVPLSATTKMIDLNCKGYAAMTEITLPYMQKGARILMLDSMSAFQPVPFITTYGATKAFVMSYSRALSMELKPRGISVMIICPGWIKTEFFDTAFKTNGDEAVNYYNRLYTSEEVARQTIKDLRRGKELSVLGFLNRWQARLVKILPVKMVMKTWIKQNSKKK